MILMRKQIADIFKSIFKSHEYNTLLGRWSHLTNRNDLDKRIDLANLDNCGCCHHPYLKKSSYIRISEKELFKD